MSLLQKIAMAFFVIGAVFGLGIGLIVGLICKSKYKDDV